MLTADLVRPVYRKEGMRVPRLQGNARARAHQLSMEMLAVANQSVGLTRMEFDEALEERAPPNERLLWRGLKKLLEDRCTFEVNAVIDPIELRSRLFAKASAFRTDQLLDDSARTRLLEELARELLTDAMSVEASLFADLKPAQRLQTVERCDADDLLLRYELGRAQAILLRAEALELRFHFTSPEVLRPVFQKLKFLQLLFSVRQERDELTVHIDGPLSLFRSSTRYGFKLAMALPVFASAPECTLRAQVLWGKARTRRVFVWERADCISELPAAPVQLAPEISRLQQEFSSISQDWKVEPAQAVFQTPGQGVCIPDLVFTHRVRQEQIYLELLGFWSRDAVWQRVDWARSGTLPRILFAYSEKLRVSEQALDSVESGALLGFKGVIPVHKLLTKLNELCRVRQPTSHEAPPRSASLRGAGPRARVR